VRLGFAHAHIVALNRVFTGIDIWILFKIFIVMPATAVFFWWQARLLQKYRQPDPARSRHGELSHGYFPSLGCG
jgi:intracellular septation protein A